MKTPIIHKNQVSKVFLTINIIMGIIYIAWWLDLSHVGNPVLYFLLFASEIYHLFMALTFWHTIWPGKSDQGKKFDDNYSPSVDIFITVVNEPLNIIKETAVAAKNMNYPNHKVYILNDGYVAKNDNWNMIEDLAESLGVFCITRTIPGGAKAGNINYALAQTSGELIVVFDADMVPHQDFLEKTVPLFEEKNLGFVQTPQFYKNHELNDVTLGSWEQQELFFGPIMNGKNKSNSAFLCGTNMVIRKSALLDVGGMYEKSIAEDFATSILIHKKGWQSHYVSDVLAEGLAPEDLLSYYKQQFRWARGSLTGIIDNNPIFTKGLKLWQRIEYLASALYYLNGPIVLMDIFMPLLFLFFGIQPVVTSTSSFAIFFIPFMIISLYTLFLTSDSSLTFRAIAFSYSTWFLQLTALQSILFHEEIKFNVTPKQAQRGNFLFLSIPHFAYILLSLIGYGVALGREGLDASVATNIAWTIFNILLFLPFIKASLPSQQLINSRRYVQAQA